MIGKKCYSWAQYKKLEMSQQDEQDPVCFVDLIKLVYAIANQIFISTTYATEWIIA